MFSKKNNYENVNLLELTPIAKYSHEVKEDGLVNVLVPKFTDWFFGRLLQPRIQKKYIKANLDEIGSATWLLIDGKRNIIEISRELESQLGDKVAPVFDRMSIFMTHLFRNGFINFIEFKKDI